MSMSKYVKVLSLEGLEGMLANGVTSFCISNGLVRSSKEIEKTKGGSYYVYHEIDDSEEILTKDELLKSNIGKAIETGCFYGYSN